MVPTLNSFNTETEETLIRKQHLVIFITSSRLLNFNQIPSELGVRGDFAMMKFYLQ